jgi:hypothetical protein
LVDVQRALVSLAQGEQARQSRDIEPALGHLRVAARRLTEIDASVARELIDRRLRQQNQRSAEALSANELESLAANVSFQLARTQRQLGLCYPTGSADRDDALLQAVERLTPLVQPAQPDALVWNSRVELATCLRELGQIESARRQVAVWLQQNPPADVAQRLSAEPDTLAPRADSNQDGAQVGDPFTAQRTAAAIEREAGRYASAAERYRRLAIGNPRDQRAAETHELAVLCVADLLRESSADERLELADFYERLLNEHLTHWPTQASADRARLWQGRLLAARRDWQGAIEILQQVRPTSADYSESVRTLAQCYQKQLEGADGDGDEAVQRRAQLLAAASRHLQPIITGADNRWPDAWSGLQRETAVSLARLHLRFSAAGSPYAERLLTAALRGQSDLPESVEVQAWEAAARVLVVEALARGGRVAEARTALGQIKNVPADSLLETVGRIEARLLDNSQTTGNREFGELVLSMVRLLDARRSELDEAAIRRLDGWRAAALAATGDRAAALAQYAALAAQLPDDGAIQERYAALLAASDSPAELRQALARWQEVESRSRRGGPRWRRARRARIELLTRLNERDEAEKLVRLTRLLYPDWDVGVNTE